MCAVFFANDVIGSAFFYLFSSVYYFYCFTVSSLMFSEVDNQAGVRGACMDGVYRELTYMFTTDYGDSIDVSKI